MSLNLPVGADDTPLAYPDTPDNALSIVIPAAGFGERLGLGPKALLSVDGRSLLSWLSAKARRAATEVIVAAPLGRLDEWAAHCPDCVVIAGDETHLGTMAKLIQAATKPWLMNLNVSMPMASLTLIRRVVEAARTYNIAGAFMTLDLPVAMVSDNTVTALLARQSVALAQGPNAYSRDLLLDLIASADDADWKRQSFLEIATLRGHKIATVGGEKTNMKITTKEDWEMAQLVKDFLR